MGWLWSSRPAEPAAPPTDQGVQQQAPPAPASPEVAAPGTAFKGIRAVLLGPPGADKGAQADKLAKKYASCHLTTSELIHAEMKSGTPLGKKIHELAIQRDEPVPDDIVCQLIDKNLSSDECRNGYIFDDFPHNRDQAQKLDELLAKREAPLQAAVELTSRDRQPETAPLVQYYSKRGIHTSIDFAGQPSDKVDQQMDKLFNKMAQPKKKFLSFSRQA